MLQTIPRKRPVLPGESLPPRPIRWPAPAPILPKIPSKMTTKTFDQFRESRVILTVSLFSEEHDGAVVVTPSGKEIGLDHENGFSFMKGDFFVSDDANAVFIYEGSFFIEQLNSFQYLLQIENESYMSTNLTSLEKILYDWID